jgi:GNAT superfamily N-acetyltransferase
MGMNPAPGIRAPAYEQPTPITAEHRLSSFRCGRPELDDWLKTHALGNEGKVSRTYVVVSGDNVVVAYYALATGRIERKEMPRKLRNNQPNDIPVVVLGRLAVDVQHSGQGIGSHLLKEAVQRTLDVSRIAGVKALIVHAISDDAVGFYTKYGFIASPVSRCSLILPLQTLERSLLAV